MEKQQDMALIVDDDRSFLDGFSHRYGQWFKRRGLALASRDTSRGARAHLRSKEGRRVVLVLVDVLLPTPKDAMDLLAHIAGRFPHIKKIALTARAEREDVGRMGAAGVIEGYIEKKWHPRKIMKEIGRVLDAPSAQVQHTMIVEALERLIKQDPEAAKRKIVFVDRGGMTFEELLQEIKRRSQFGRKQARLLFQMQIDGQSRTEKVGGHPAPAAEHRKGRTC